MRRTLGQMLRYGLVGLFSNGLSYLLYLLITSAGLGPLMAMTVIYTLATLATFLLNRGWSFGHVGAHESALARYCAAYLLGYAIDWLGLWLLVEMGGYPHQLAQGAMVVIVAAVLFVLLQRWVFQNHEQVPT